MPEQERPVSSTVECIAPHGLGYGEGKISTVERAQTDMAFSDKLAFIGDKIVNDSETFKSVEANDDGCGDGRGVLRIFQRYFADGLSKVISFNRSLRRAKVFGGGAAVGASMWRTINRRPRNGETVQGDIGFIVDEFSERRFAHGAHTDTHAQGEKCGCGAIDNYPLVTSNALKFRESITENLKAIYGGAYADNHYAIETAFAAYEELAQDEGYFSNANGKKTMETLLDDGAVVKELDGEHREGAIILNEIEGTTVDQVHLATLLAEKFGKDTEPVQAFVVDTWRGRQIAEEITKIAKNVNPDVDEDEVRRVAFADFLIRTLAVAATLTKGDLPVYHRRAVKEYANVAA